MGRKGWSPLVKHKHECAHLEHSDPSETRLPPTHREALFPFDPVPHLASSKPQVPLKVTAKLPTGPKVERCRVAQDAEPWNLQELKGQRVRETSRSNCPFLPWL